VTNNKARQLHNDKTFIFSSNFSIDNKGMQIALVDSLKVKQVLNGNHKKQLKINKGNQIKKAMIELTVILKKGPYS